MKEKLKKILKDHWWLLLAVVLGIAAAVCLIILIFNDVNSGWNGNKTVNYAFFVIIFLCGVSCVHPLYHYFLINNKEMIKSNNDLYRTLEKAENDETLKQYKIKKYNDAREKALAKINNYLYETTGQKISLSHESIKSFIHNEDYSKKPYNLDDDQGIYLRVLYYEYRDKYSKEYEVLFSKYKSGDLVKLKDFPLFNFIIPLIVSFLGIFISVYQYVALSEQITDSLLRYVIVIIETTTLVLVASISTANNDVSSRVKANDIIIKDIKALRNAKQQ